MTSDPRQENLVHHLRALLGEGGDYNRLIVSSGDAYLQFIASRGAHEIECEAVTNASLPPAEQLTPARLAVLQERGFGDHRKRRNLVRRRTCAEPGRDLEAIARDALEVLALAYGRDAGAPLDLALHLGDREATSNVPLLRSMKKLARLRDMGARQEVYRGVLGGEFLLVVDPAAEDRPHVVEHLQGMPVYAAFTDWDALRLWEPRGWPYRVIAGTELFPLAEERRIASLLINPRGEIGGELLMNEIAGLADAARRRRN